MMKASGKPRNRLTDPLPAQRQWQDVILTHTLTDTDTHKVNLVGRMKGTESRGKQDSVMAH